MANVVRRPMLPPLVVRFLVPGVDCRHGDAGLRRERLALAEARRGDRGLEDALRHRLYGPCQPRRRSLSDVDGRSGPEAGRREPRLFAGPAIRLDPGRLADGADSLAGADRGASRQFVAAMRAGRLVPHALAFTTHTESLDLEDLTRGFRYSVEMARLAGQPLPTGCKMTDVPDHTRGLATVLANAGVKFFHHGCNDNCSPADVPQLYWWQGPDGSRVLTMFSPTYGSDLCPPAGWPHKTWLCMWMTYDNQGPPNAKMVEALFATAKRLLPGVRVRFGRLSDFADAIFARKPRSAGCSQRHAGHVDTWNRIDADRNPVGPRHPAADRGASSRSTRFWECGACRLDRSVRPSATPMKTPCSSASTPGAPTSPDTPAIAMARSGRRSWPPANIASSWRDSTRSGPTRQSGRDGRSGHRTTHDRIGRRDECFRPPDRRLQSAPLEARRRGRRALDGAATALTDAASQETLAAAAENGRLRFVARNLPPLGYRTFIPAQGATRGNVSADPARSASRTSGSA